MKEIEKILKALANQRRLAILKYLNKIGHASVGDIADHIHLSFKSTSRHLSVMHSGGVLDRNQINLTVFYSLHKPLDSIVKATLTIL